MKKFFICLFISTAAYGNEKLFCDSRYESTFDKGISGSECAQIDSSGRLLLFKPTINFEEIFKNHQNEFKARDGRFKNNRSLFLKDLVLITKKQKIKFVYVNAEGRGYEAYPFDNGADYFQGGYARVLVNNKIGFIDKKGNLVIPPKYEFVSSFSNGYAKACKVCERVKHGEHLEIKSDNWIIIDKKGSIRSEIPKVITFPFSRVAFDRYKSDLKIEQNENTPEMRKAYKQACIKSSEACLNYFALLVDNFFSKDLGHYNFSLTKFSNSKTYIPSRGEAELSEPLLISIVKKGCKEELRVCALLGMVYYALEQHEKAKDVLSKACGKGQGHSCHYHGIISDLDFNRKKSLYFFKKACEVGLEESCHNMSLFLK